MTIRDAEPHGLAAFCMYDMHEVRPATDRLWSAIAARLPGAPTALAWDGDYARQWLDPDLVLGQACGWPVVATLVDRVRVVGAFRYRGFDDDNPDGATRAAYHSVLVARDDRPLAEFAGATGAVNSWDSLSGWVSLAAALEPHAPSGAPFFASVVTTGAHLASIEAVQQGRADLAAIDGVTHALLSRHRPAALDGLVSVGRGPTIPTLPIITANDDPGPARDAVAAATADPALADVLDALLIESFVTNNEASYADVMTMSDLAHRLLPPPA